LPTTVSEYAFFKALEDQDVSVMSQKTAVIQKLNTLGRFDFATKALAAGTPVELEGEYQPTVGFESTFMNAATMNGNVTSYTRDGSHVKMVYVANAYSGVALEVSGRKYKWIKTA